MLLIDIGSTYTKLAVLDESSKQLITTASSPTTIEDVSIGFSRALHKVVDLCLPDRLLEQRYACSSAAGGLRMISVGLVPELTVEAAKRAALGAGAKVIATYSFQLMDREIGEIEDIRPDIILLAGGIDGGDKKTVVHNAGRIVSSHLNVPVVFAGNREASDEVQAIFERRSKELYLADNVLPTVTQINVDAVREIIREVFLRRIVVAKGLDKINRVVDEIISPTPLAVLEAAKVFARVTKGGVVIVDVGGATTDVHSVADGVPYDPQIVLKGLPEPYAKRTVEGDIGVRYSMSGIVETVGRDQFLENAGLPPEFGPDRLGEMIALWSSETSSLPSGELEERLDCGLAAMAVDIAMKRHAGYLEEVWTPAAKLLVQYGKDLTRVETLIGTGGPIIHSKDPREILKEALYDARTPFTLEPQNPALLVDSSYILFAIGLISRVCAEDSEEIASNYLKGMEVV